ncbi:C40 family peptidase (plasmid) [Kovacikia minuta CCNUW1]|uniref:C40 family peptidase n=1 Tax=Kovacikia minuta TaxID=2931930 RepID=UPI001CD03C37|nr:C40 family peptidase [Kovacikia minuta]UBF30108.1 C40 family peptidase [Kovacikia minuta CCNUW1]
MAPETSLPDVIDGIAWERGMHLQGTVQDNLSDVEVAYAIERASDGEAISQHSFTVTGSPNGTTFDQVIDELAANNSVLQEEEVYNLILTSTDIAGNSQRTRFQFFVPGDRRVEDDDQWTEGGSTGPFSDPPKTVDPDGDDVQTWGKVGKDGNWGYYSGGGSGGGGGWTPGYNGGPLTPEGKEGNKGPTGSGYEFEYVESIDQILTVAVDSISTHPTTINEKAALNNRKNILLGIGERLATLITPEGFKQASDQALINRMELVMQGLFVDAFDSQGVKAGVYEGFEHWAGAWLAQELIGDALNSTSPTSVRVQVFQATLLDVVTEATPGVTDLAEQQALATAVMQLAQTYAWLNPNPEATVPVEDEVFGFLDRLWRLQVPDANGQFKDSEEIAAALQKGVSELGQLLDGVNDPVKAIQFLSNLVQAASNVTSLKGDMKNATFLRELIEFGVEYTKMNPDDTPSSNDDALNTFLNRFWRGEDQSLGQGGLSALFKGVETHDGRIDLLNFQGKMFEAIKMVPDLETDRKSPSYLANVVAVTGYYAASKLNLDQGFIYEENDFLKSLWQAQNQNDIVASANRLKAFITGNEVSPLPDLNVSGITDILPLNLEEFSSEIDKLGTLEKTKSLGSALASKEVAKVLSEISRFSTTNRQVILQSEPLMNKIRAFSDESSITITAALLKGSLNWVPVGAATDFYKHFVEQRRVDSLPSSSSMNCWEFALYAGYLSGRITPEEIRNFYTFPPPGGFSESEIWKRLGWRENLPDYKEEELGRIGKSSAVPRVGDLIFFTPLESKFLGLGGKSSRSLPGHVGISMGGNSIINLIGSDSNPLTTDPARIDKIIDLYRRPDGGGFVQVGIPITQLSGFR